MTAQFVTFEIPVYPLVKKFLAYHYNTSPFEVSNIRNPYSSYLYACLDRYDYRDTVLPKKYNRLTETMTLGVASWRNRSFAAGKISPTKVSCFNDFVRQTFFERLTQEVALRTSLGAGLGASVERVLNRYGLTEDELSLRDALRYYYRTRRKLLPGVATLECCPIPPEDKCVILPHERIHAERDQTDWQMESGRRQVA